MFSALLLPILLASYQSDARPQQSVEEEIIVIGERLNSLSVIVGRAPNGNLTCSLDKSSGSLRIDDKKPKLLAKLRREMKAERK